VDNCDNYSSTTIQFYCKFNNSLQTKVSLWRDAFWINDDEIGKAVIIIMLSKVSWGGLKLRHSAILSTACY